MIEIKWNLYNVLSYCQTCVEHLLDLWKCLVWFLGIWHQYTTIVNGRVSFQKVCECLTHLVNADLVICEKVVGIWLEHSTPRM